MKTLTAKRVDIAVCYQGLRNTPPKAFPHLGEMEKTGEILETLEKAVPEFVEMLKAGEELNTELQSGKLGPEEGMAKKQEFSQKSNALEGDKGKQEMDVEFENEAFNTFFQQFERWGKDWFMKLETFLAFRKAMTKTNSQPKSKGK